MWINKLNTFVNEWNFDKMTFMVDLRNDIRTKEMLNITQRKITIERKCFCEMIRPVMLAHRQYAIHGFQLAPWQDWNDLVTRGGLRYISLGLVAYLFSCRAIVCKRLFLTHRGCPYMFMAYMNNQTLFFVLFSLFYATYIQDTFRTCLNDHVSFAQQNYHTNTNYWLLYNVVKCTCFGARSHSLVARGGQLYPESYSLWSLFRPVVIRYRCYLPQPDHLRWPVVSRIVKQITCKSRC